MLWTVNRLMLLVCVLTVNIISSRTFLDTSPIGLDFSCITLPKLRTPVSDRKIKSVPVDCTVSLAIQPMFVIASASTILDGELAPEYNRILRLPKITKKSLNLSGRSIHQKALVKFNAVSEKRHLNIHHTTYFSSTPTLFTADAQLKGRVESASMNYMNAAVLRMTITMTSNSGQLVSCHNWFDKTEVYAQSGSRLLSTLYPETLLFNLQQLPKNVRKAANIDPDTYTHFVGDISSGLTKSFIFLCQAQSCLSECILRKSRVIW